MAWILLPLCLLFGLFLRTRHFDYELTSHHSWRQAHVASNIFFLLKNGYGLKMQEFNKTQREKIFDGPLYQNLVAAVCRATGSRIVPAARLVNLFTYIGLCLTLFFILVEIRVSVWTGLATVFLYSASPLTVYYDRAVIPDNLATLLAFLSLLGYLRCTHWSGPGQARSMFWYALMVIAGVAATFIKSPVMFPVALTIVAHCCIFRSWRDLLDHHMLSFFTILLMTVVVFTAYSNYVNFGSFHTPDYKWSWYFSDLQGRMQLAPYRELIRRMHSVLVPPAAFGFSVLGLFLLLLGSNRRQYSMILILLASSIITSLVFFNVHQIHDYYQIPFVFVMCACAAIFISEVWKLVLSGRPSPRRSLICHVALAISMIALVSISYYPNRIAFNVDPRIQEAGRFIRAHTPSDGCVFYVIEKSESNSEAVLDPSYLWYARREGYMLHDEQCRSPKLARLSAQYFKTARQVFLFVPKGDDSLIEGDVENSFPRIVARSDAGVLYTSTNHSTAKALSRSRTDRRS
ncbi:MAG: hypothetical protein ACE5EQ_08080 [Phycisphaerae bacterium]